MKYFPLSVFLLLLFSCNTRKEENATVLLEKTESLYLQETPEIILHRPPYLNSFYVDSNFSFYLSGDREVIRINNHDHSLLSFLPSDTLIDRVVGEYGPGYLSKLNEERGYRVYSFFYDRTSKKIAVNYGIKVTESGGQGRVNFMSKTVLPIQLVLDTNLNVVNNIGFYPKADTFHALITYDMPFFIRGDEMYLSNSVQKGEPMDQMIRVYQAANKRYKKRSTDKDFRYAAKYLDTSGTSIYFTPDFRLVDGTLWFSDRQYIHGEAGATHLILDNPDHRLISFNFADHNNVLSIACYTGKNKSLDSPLFISSYSLENKDGRRLQDLVTLNECYGIELQKEDLYTIRKRNDSLFLEHYKIKLIPKQ